MNRFSVGRSRRLIMVFFLCLSSVSCASMQCIQRCMEGTANTEVQETPLIGATEEFFLQSDRLFREGKYRQALRRTRRIYEEATDTEVKEEALFRVALILSYGDNPNRDYDEAEKVVRDFLKAYPDSPRVMAMRSILQLLLEIHRGRAEVQTIKGYNAIQEEKILRLEEDIRRIKEIDLQLEEQKKQLE
jgi:outer membrane protein assembly factor BamD (BamD/ComL family)